MDLKGRLKMIAGKVPACNTLCDVGTDHAYIPIYLTERGICKKAIASDVRPGPLQSAEENIRTSGLKDRIETRLGNGLETVAPGEADVVVIAGMGGILIKDLLAQDINKTSRIERLILQPMNAIEVVREWLYTHGFEIMDEELAQEGDKIYNVIVARKADTPTQDERIYYYIGRKLIERKDPLLETLLDRRINKLEVILQELENTREEAGIVKEEYSNLLIGYKRILHELNM